MKVLTIHFVGRLNLYSDFALQRIYSGHPRQLLHALLYLLRPCSRDLPPPGQWRFRHCSQNCLEQVLNIMLSIMTRMVSHMDVANKITPVIL